MRFMDAMLVVDAPVGNVAAWCRDNGVNSRTFYRHRARIRAEGQWRQRPRRPRSSPQASPGPVVVEVCRLRAVLAPDNGADQIRAELGEHTPPGWAQCGYRVPARATINRILDRAGLLDKNPAKRPRASYRRFCYARPRDCYQIDGTEHTLAGGATAVAIDVIDDCSRVWVASHVAAAETIEAGLAAIGAAAAEWGAPGLVLADNGTAFAHPHRSRDKSLTSRFSRTVAAELGSRVIHSSPYHPQTCGKCERLHATAAKLLTHLYPQPPADLAQLQTRLDTVRVHYNTRRRHSAHGHRTPHRAWTEATSHGGPGDLPRQSDATVHVLRVVANGTVALADYRLSVGRAHTGTTITVLRSGDHITAHSPTGDVLGELHLDPTRGPYQGSLTPAA